MSWRIWSGVAAVCLSLVLAGPAAAIPYGSYQQSCKDIKLKDRDGDSARIQARCRDGRGEWRKTSFELDRCWGDLANIDGELVCVADQSHGGRPGFPDQSYAGGAYPPGPGYPGQAHPPGQGHPPGGGYPGGPAGRPKDVATDVCIDWAVRAAYQEGAGYARLLRIEDVDRKDAGRIKVKGIILTSRDREDRRSQDRPFRCDSRQGQILEFKWR
jgi:hypothetical protein